MTTNQNKPRIVVVGNGMVGHHFIEQLIQSGANQTFDVQVFGEEKYIAYDRVHLSEYFTGKNAEDLSLTTSEFYKDNNIDFHADTKVVAIDAPANSIRLDDCTQVDYDKLILATGSYPFVPPIPGHKRDNTFVYRTFDDLDAMRECAKDCKTGTVVGGGLLGLEAANALKNLGLETQVVEFAPRLMPVQLDETGGAMLKDMIEGIGVDVYTATATNEIVDGEAAFHRMNFADGSHLETDLILFSAGIRPQDELARTSGLTLGERGGIEINNVCQTSVDNIYAIGECALWNGKIFGLVAPGYTMAKVAADHVIGNNSLAFEGADMSTKLKLLGCDVGSIGDAHQATQGAKSFVYQDEISNAYRKIVVSEDGSKLLGAVLVGDNSYYDTLLQYYLNGIDLPKEPQGLILPASDGAPAALGVDALPDTASICSCHNVTKADINAAVAGGATGVADVKGITKAATGCGGCAALLKKVVDNELLALGIEVSTDICEHFAYTRQDLFNLIKVEGIKTFAELLDKHGKGKGCDICKPAVGSILASVWNDYVLGKEHVALQDTNDRYLANMQKDGTYSVVPRIPGGEITPDGLIAIGDVAKRYNLYTKITGGQRIDLFGATLPQLPKIWSELVDAGFETGQAYGKSVRTVKSCVGSTWCRYGVNDSVGMAIYIENRYKGLRGPHKIKFAVSGCTRECAEAQSKDIGVIATENGWNLYVCGNGGMKPRHADLFATDLTDEELIRYIDRVLMLYVKTADRLQRTATWMDNLEGGLDYLKDVIIEDSLDLGAELEAQMQHIVDTFQCEWTTTLKDEKALKKFRQFVNADEEDNNVVFVEERGQIRPATESEKYELIAKAV
ncbi:nitrite reductase large subunit NirB [Marinomonas mediterranea]|jgi:nitrite reductase [NAD(P)H], large subunit|uniref:Nitrite reductase (NAD(P)H), large subunit n=1 Tax=Marinomonas mediterranea (strain ATCC 700492 / JCM 21426 / NBRC 103028 / MMB-1) TaxID=717774 RepID=F2JXS0_MARM1|nr:nitrite reductase large subunit NirB [Marinomonas mediterranea]ADZ93068.1 nitrite reductase (NAD(P)H), large subunit [Marinomonas mediterranea MMB-1]WCN19080.1 nitrite reductase large subunit [Marinomonas mediterranea MMB-1]